MKNKSLRRVNSVKKYAWIFYVHGSVQRESMSIIVQQDATMYSLLYFLQTALHVSGDTFTHLLEHL